MYVYGYSLSDSPYHDVSGLPNPYNMDHMEQDDGVMMSSQQQQKQQQQQQLQPGQQQQHHMSLNYDDSFVEGDYSSTPNSRNRRVIREIIV